MAKNFQYVLPVGTTLVSRDKNGERRYTIEQVINGAPLHTGEPIPPNATLAPALGQGGFGITYLASREIRDGNILLGKGYYAIKEFFPKEHCYRREGETKVSVSPTATDVGEGMKDFRNEALRLKEICQGNRNIVNVNEVFEANGTSYYVMEFISGISLRTLIQREGPLPEVKALSIIRPIAEALQFIHSQYRLLHLDVKPDNIMLKPNSMGGYDPILIDFGISIHFDKKGNVTTTHHSASISPPFSPREQYNGIVNIVDGRRKLQKMGISNMPLLPCEVDMYALGATLFYMLVGQEPLDAFSIKPEYVNRQLPEDISESTRQLVIKAMQPEPEHRIKTAAEFLKGFEKRYTLPLGYVLKGGRALYLITDIQDELPYALHYGATLYTGEQQNGDSQNITIRKRYDIYEYFVHGHHRRLQNEAIEGERSFENEAGFERMAQKLTGLQQMNEADEKDGIIQCETFSANNTYYATCYQDTKSTRDNLIEGVRNTVSKHQKILTAVAALIIGMVAVLLLKPIFTSNNFSNNEGVELPLEETEYARPEDGTVYYNNSDKSWSYDRVDGQTAVYEYTGELNADLLPDGKGSCKVSNGKDKYVVEGTWKNGKPQSGVLTYDDGTGFWSDNFKNTIESVENDGSNVPDENFFNANNKNEKIPAHLQ